MTEKIEWYQEVLELEPSSKVFFPLAKLLAANSRQAEAISTLKHGLDRHPEFFEARLMLVDLLARAGQKESSLYEAERISSKLSGYPGFLQAWASISEKEGHGDTAIALKLLSTFLEGKELSLLDIIRSGINTACLERGQGNEEAAVEGSGDAISPLGFEPEKEEWEAEPFVEETPAVSGKKLPRQKKSEEENLNIKGAEEVSLELEEIPEPLPREMLGALPEFIAGEEFEAATGEAVGEILGEPATGAAYSEVYEHEADEEPFSLRTKTMATVLIEQGDYNGALEIYEELLAACEDAEKRDDLEARIEELKHKIGAMEQKAEQPAASLEVKEQPLHTNQKTFDFLKTLAKRLEMRAE